MAPYKEEEEEENATLDNNVGDEVGEDEDDEDDFAETLEQLKRLQGEVEDLQKKRQEDIAALRLAETKRDTTLKDFENFKVMSAEKELHDTKDKQIGGTVSKGGLKSEGKGA